MLHRVFCASDTRIVAEVTMIVACPSCETRFIVAEAEIGTRGRLLRCSRCAHTWRHDGVGAEDVARSSGAGDAPLSLRDARDQRRAAVAAMAGQDSGGSSSIGWALLLLVIAGGGIGLYLGRLPIVQAWPQAVVAYEALGIPLGVAGEGFDIRDITTQRRDDSRILVVEGTIVNTLPEARQVPPLKAIAGVKGQPQPLKEWIFASQLGALQGGAVGGFRVELTDLPPASNTLVVTFPEKHEIPGGQH